MYVAKRCYKVRMQQLTLIIALHVTFEYFIQNMNFLLFNRFLLFILDHRLILEQTFSHKSNNKYLIPHIVPSFKSPKDYFKYGNSRPE